MVSSSSFLFLSIFLVLIISPALSLNCTSDKFNANKRFVSCNDLPTLNAHLHYTYNSTNSSLSVAFKAAPANSGGWVAWALNLNGTGMAGAQAFVGWKSSGSSIVVKKFNIASYSDLKEVSKLEFDSWDVSGESDSKGNLVIFASVKLSSLDKVNQIWQVGPSVANGIPAKHDFNQANLLAKGTINLTGTNASISPSASPTSSPTAPNSTTAGTTNSTGNSAYRINGGNMGYLFGGFVLISTVLSF